MSLKRKKNENAELTPKSSKNDNSTPIRSSARIASKSTNDEISTPLTTKKNIKSAKKLDFTENDPISKIKTDLKSLKISPETPSKTSAKKGSKTPSKTSAKKLSKTPSKTSAKKGSKTPSKTSAKKLSKTPSKTSAKKVSKTPSKTSAKKVSKKLIDDFSELNIYQQYKKILSATTETDLVFREKETKEIDDFFKENLQNNNSSSIYISGPPGVGKTATVTSILDNLSNKFKFKSLFLNCMRFTTPNSLYKTIISQLTNKDNEESNLFLSIADKLTKCKNMVILVLDEIDILDKLHQEMLNNVFSFPNFKGTKVIIVGISNTLDFTSKKLNKNNSLDLKPIKSISFTPYSFEEIRGIIKNCFAKVNSTEELIQDKAISLCARKVSAYSGDARKALEIMRRSIELVEQESNSMKLNVLREQNQQSEPSPNQIKMVSIQHVDKILKLVFGSSMELDDDDYDFPIQQKLVICLLLLFNKEGNKNPDLDKCFNRFQKICKERDIQFEIRNTKTFLEVCELLETKSYLIVQKSKNLRCIKLMLSISPGEAELLLGKNQLIKYILS